MSISLFNVKKLIDKRRVFLESKIQERKAEIDEICGIIERILVEEGECTFTYEKDKVFFEKVTENLWLACLKSNFELIKPDLERNGLIVKETTYEIQLRLPFKHCKYLPQAKQ